MKNLALHQKLKVPFSRHTLQRGLPVYRQGWLYDVHPDYFVTRNDIRRACSRVIEIVNDVNL
jgi:adenosylmethionine-8-amino-7-oxononanoate aminotransferase